MLWKFPFACNDRAGFQIEYRIYPECSYISGLGLIKYTKDLFLLLVISCDAAPETYSYTGVGAAKQSSSAHCTGIPVRQWIRDGVAIKWSGNAALLF
jgi:hypothetical protein